MKRRSLWAPWVMGALTVACTQSYDDFVHDTATSTSTTTTGSGAAGMGGSGATGGEAQGGSGATGATGGGGETGGNGSGGSGGAVGSVLCDVAPCDVSTGGVCCLPRGSGGPACEPSGTDCETFYTTVTCDGPDDCPGQICCGRYQTGSYAWVRCEDSCDGFGYYTLCNPAGPNICDGNETCQESDPLPDSYFVCKE